MADFIANDRQDIVSLFNFAIKDDFKDLDAYAKTRSTPYGVSFESICREVMGTKQRAQLRKLVGFRFIRHPSLNWSEERLLKSILIKEQGCF